MTTQSQIVIAGGGLNGGTMALALAQQGWPVVLVDPMPATAGRGANFDGRAYALAISSCRLLTALGLWPALAAEAQPMVEIKVTDGRAGEGPSPHWLHFERGEIDEGPMGHMVEDRHLRPALLDALEAEVGVTCLFGTSVTAQEPGPGGMSVTLSSGEALEAAILIGADGRGSGVATRAGIGRMAWGYDQTAVVCALAHERPHGGVAHQFFMPGGPLAILPLNGNRSSIVWSMETAEAERLLALDDSDFLDALRPAFGDFLGKIGLEGLRFGYPLGLSLAHSFVAPRLALVGDAAHGVHPLAGQGLNAGLKDVAALAHVTEEARKRGEDIGSSAVLARYQRWRRFDTGTLAFATDGINRLFSNDNPVLRGLRDLGLGAVDAMPGLRRSLAREAAGLTGELPRLMRG